MGGNFQFAHHNFTAEKLSKQGIITPPIIIDTKQKFKSKLFQLL
jgi:hypothetical protein